MPYDLGFLHYASDTPISRRQTLLSKSLSYFGVDATYATSVAVMRRILRQEANRMARLKDGADPLALPAERKSWNYRQGSRDTMKWGGDSFQPPHGAYWLYYTIHGFTTVVKPLFVRLHVEGHEHFPATGGYVLTANHTAGPDFIPLGYAVPRQIYFMAKSELLAINPFLTKFLLVNGVFPIRRGEADMEAIQYAIDLVRSGHVLGMFPEGTRSRTGKLQRGRSGAARIAILAQAPVVPIVVLNATHIFKTSNWLTLKPRAEVTVRIGKPLPPPVDPNDSRALRIYTRQIMQAMTDLLPEELRPEATQSAPGSASDAAPQQAAREDEG